MDNKFLISIKLPPGIGKVIKTFRQANWQIYIVGGAVRDSLLKRSSHDWDLTTDASPKDILQLFPKNSFYHNKFGTVTVNFKKQKLEITPFRRESKYRDFRHPSKIEWGKNLKDDLGRRDFTINAMALAPQATGRQFQLIDPYQGREDLRQKLIRAVGDPQKRFREDALRMMRAVRFSSQFGFLIEKETFSAIKKNAQLIKKIAAERIRDELWKILDSPFPAEGINFLRTSGLLHYIIPELEKGYGLAQAKHHIYDVWTHSLKALGNCPSSDPLVRFAALIHDIGKPYTVKGSGEQRTFYNHEVVGARIARKLAARLRLNKKDSQRLWRLVRWHQFTMDEHQSDKALRRFIRQVGKSNLQDILDIRTADRIGSGSRPTSWRFELFRKRLLDVQKQPFSLRDLKINGHDVMESLHLKPSPLVGKILEKLFQEIVADQKKNQRRYLLKQLPAIYRQIKGK